MRTETHAEARLPFDTHFEFTVAKLKQVARAVQEIGRDQVELCCKIDRGLRAFVYGKSGKIVLYSRYNYRKQPKRIRLGELGLISLDQARQKHREIRLTADQGTDPKAAKKAALTFAELHHQHYVVECQSRQKITLHTDQSRYDHWLGPEFGHLPLPEITSTLISQFVIKMQEAKLAPATIKKIVVQLRSCLPPASSRSTSSRTCLVAKMRPNLPSYLTTLCLISLSPITKSLRLKPTAVPRSPYLIGSASSSPTRPSGTHFVAPLSTSWGTSVSSVYSTRNTTSTPRCLST